MGVKRSRGDSLPAAEDPSRPFSRAQSVDAKLVHIDSDAAASRLPVVMKCLLPPHEPLAFASYDEYDVHYKKMHTNRCSACQKNFPDEHILHLHISENHDPFIAAKRERGEQTYACLVPTCDRLCSTAPKRRMHCVDKHQFPRNYDFFIINDGIDRRNSMLRPAHRRRSSTMGSATLHAGRCGGEASVSADGDSMDVVQKEEHDPEVHQQQRDSRSPHVKLRGRGGFSHPRGHGRGHELHGQLATTSQPVEGDVVDSLTSSMSALHFVPHSVRTARGRGRGRGGC